MNEHPETDTGTQEREIEVAVLGSARLTEDDERWHLAYRLGELLAEVGFTVLTGGYGGLMAAVSRGAHAKGGQVIGLPMQHWTQLSPNTWNTALRWSSNYAARLHHIERSDAVVALPGGIGTLSELTLAWAARQTEGRTTPLVLLGACWPPLLAAIREHLVVNDEDIQLLHCVNSPEEALQVLQRDLHVPGRPGSGPVG
jgi:uncharacterized protein (TIGR00730 family)